MMRAAAPLLAFLLLAPGASAIDIPLADRQSGYAIMSRESRAMQDDD